MSSIDSPDIIRKLIERHGLEPAKTWKGKTLLISPRTTTEQIWQYTTGFGGICYKLIYGMYQNRMDDVEATARFLATANMKAGTNAICLFHSGRLTAAGIQWWKLMWGELPLPK